MHELEVIRLAEKIDWEEVLLNKGQPHHSRSSGRYDYEVPHSAPRQKMRSYIAHEYDLDYAEGVSAREVIEIARDLCIFESQIHRPAFEILSFGPEEVVFVTD